MIFDEAHLIDDYSRGVKYELLLTSLKMKLSTETQIVFISAVLKNAEDISKWLLGSNGVQIEGSNLLPTNKNISLIDWAH